MDEFRQVFGDLDLGPKDHPQFGKILYARTGGGLAARYKLDEDSGCNRYAHWGAGIQAGRQGPSNPPQWSGDSRPTPALRSASAEFCFAKALHPAASQDQQPLWRLRRDHGRTSSAGRHRESSVRAQVRREMNEDDDEHLALDCPVKR